MSMNEARFAPKELDLIHTAIEPGDIVLEGIKCIISGSAANRLAILTNTSIHFMAYRMSTHGNAVMINHSTVPLSSVSAVSTTKKGKNFLITFWWEGHQENMRSNWLNEAEEFAGRLKHLVATKETSQETTSMADEIAKLSHLADEGILSQDELARAKELFLGQPQSKIDQSMQLLRNLKELNKQGILSESEFNMKKWDVLSKKDFQ